MLGNKAPPNCPSSWLNVPNLYNFSVAIDEALPTIITMEELDELLWSWFNYVDCIKRWFFLVFPWHLGTEYQ